MTDPSLARIKGAHDLSGDLDNLTQYYRDWAEGYDSDVEDEGYVGPSFLVDCLFNVARQRDVAFDLERPGLDVLDVGCGTGLVGAVLKERGLRAIDGFDLSSEMVDRARDLDVYRELWGEQPLAGTSEAVGGRRWDVTLACGVFTLGHVPPTELSEMFKLTAPGGLAVVTTRKSYADETDFVDEVERVQARGEATLVDRVLDGPYIKEEGAHYWAFRVGAAS